MALKGLRLFRESFKNYRGNAEIDVILSFRGFLFAETRTMRSVDVVATGATLRGLADFTATDSQFG